MKPNDFPPDPLKAVLRRFDPADPLSATESAAIQRRIFAHIDADEANGFRPFSLLATPAWMMHSGHRSWLSAAGSLAALCILGLGFFVFQNAATPQIAFYADPFESQLLAMADTQTPLSLEPSTTYGDNDDAE